MQLGHCYTVACPSRMCQPVAKHCMFSVHTECVKYAVLFCQISHSTDVSNRMKMESVQATNVISKSHAALHCTALL